MQSVSGAAEVPAVTALNAAFNTSELDASITLHLDDGDQNAQLQNIDWSTSATGAVLTGDIEIGFMGDQVLLD